MLAVGQPPLHRVCAGRCSFSNNGPDSSGSARAEGAHPPFVARNSQALCDELRCDLRLTSRRVERHETAFDVPINPDTGSAAGADCRIVVARHGDRVLCIEEEAFVVDLATSKQTFVADLPFSVAEASGRSGPFVSTWLAQNQTVVIDIERATVVGLVPGVGLGLADEASVLIRDTSCGARGLITQGPIHWVRPIADCDDCECRGDVRRSKDAPVPALSQRVPFGGAPAPALMCTG